MNEFQQIDAIRSLVQGARGTRLDETIVGIGDDAAVLRWKNANLVLTTDAQVEGVHFTFETSRPDELGFRLLAVNVSDLAAMGATPKAALVSLCLGPNVDSSFLKKFYQGMLVLARRCGVEIVGGNLSRSKKLSVFDLTAVGSLKKQPLTRSGAQAGDLIAVTGNIGDSAAGLFALQKLGKKARQSFAPQVARHLRPVPQSDLGPLLLGLATSCIDISDGLSSELNHLAEASALTCWVQEKKIPTSAGLHRLAEKYRRDPSEWVLHGGEDYQLLFTVPPRNWKAVEKAAKRAKTSVRVIGFTVRRKPKGGRARPGEPSELPPVQMLRLNGNTVTLKPRGWVHF